MKPLFAVFFVSLFSAALSASANLPKLALAEVAVSPALDKKYNSAATDDASQSVDLTGVWTGDAHMYHKIWPYVLTITKTADGGQSAELKNIRNGNTFRSTAFARNDRRITIRLGDNGKGKSQFLDGNLSANGLSLDARWNNGDTATSRIIFQRSQTLSSTPSGSGTIAPIVSLEAITHAVEIQLSDRFAAEHSFNIVEGDDLQNAIPTKPNAPYNLKNAGIAQQFKQAGINFLLVTTIEDLKNEIVDRAQGRVAYQTGTVKAAVSKKKKKVAKVTAEEQATQGKFDDHRVINQSVFLLTRCRLYDAVTGVLLDTANHTFSTNRTYVALAAGAKEVSASDLFAVAALDLADWAASRVQQTAFPIRILAKTGPEVSLTSSADAHLHVGQIFNVYATGNELKDPSTGETLGSDERLVGRVSIEELQPKFSKAKIREDNGIAVGNILRQENK